MRISKIDISIYLKMSNTPAGAILQHIINKIDVTQKQLSVMTGVLPQHINALIKGTRRFSPESSLRIEAALGLETNGFFYTCQCNYDITMAKKAKQSKPDFNSLRKSTFWDVDLEKVDWDKGRRWAIQRVLEYGCKGDFAEIARLYGIDSVREEFARLKRSHNGNLLRNASNFGLL